MAKKKRSAPKAAKAAPKEQIVAAGNSHDSSRTLGTEDSYSNVGNDFVLPQQDGVLNGATAAVQFELEHIDEGNSTYIGDSSAAPNSPKTHNRNYSGFFRGSDLDEYKLEEFPEIDGPVSFEETDLVDINDAWSFSLIGGFSDKFPGLKAIRALVDSWKIPCTIFPHNEAWVLLKFSNELDMERVLFGGPYTVFRRAFFLQKLPKFFNFCNMNWTVPVWAQLPGLPLDCWHPRALSKIASKIGKPISTDKLTMQKKCISYARILVEVDASKELPSKIPLCFPGGKTIEQSVVYEHTPKYCKSCFRFGHLMTNCAAAGKKTAPDCAENGATAAGKNQTDPRFAVTETPGAVPTALQHPTVATHQENSGMNPNPPPSTNLAGSRDDGLIHDQLSVENLAGSLPPINFGNVSIDMNLAGSNLVESNLADSNVVKSNLAGSRNGDLCANIPSTSLCPPSGGLCDDAPFIRSSVEDTPFTVVESNKKKQRDKSKSKGVEKATKPHLVGPRKPQVSVHGGRRPNH